MATITEDYKIQVTTPDGEIIATIDLLDYNLEKSMACSSIMSEVKEAIAIYERAKIDLKERHKNCTHTDCNGDRYHGDLYGCPTCEGLNG